MSIHSKNFDLPAMTGHNAMQDIAIEEDNKNGSESLSEDTSEYEVFDDEENYVSPEAVSPKTQESIEKLKQEVTRLRGSTFLKMWGAINHE